MEEEGPKPSDYIRDEPGLGIKRKPQVTFESSMQSPRPPRRVHFKDFVDDTVVVGNPKPAPRPLPTSAPPEMAYASRTIMSGRVRPVDALDSYGNKIKEFRGMYEVETLSRLPGTHAVTVMGDTPTVAMEAKEALLDAIPLGMISRAERVRLAAIKTVHHFMIDEAAMYGFCTCIHPGEPVPSPLIAPVEEHAEE